MVMIASRAPRPRWPTLGPEAQLLVDTLRARFDPGSGSGISERIAPALDSQRLLSLAGRHGVTPLLFLEVERGPASAPAELIRELRSRTSRNTARQLLLVAELREILDALDRHGIRAVPFKGPALAAALYGNVALREARDLDLLVRRADVPAARRLMLDRGFHPDTPLTRAAEAAHLEIGCDLELRRADGLMVEIHWALFHRYFSFPLEASCWGRMTRASLLGREVASLSVEDQLLLLAGHGTKHCWERLIWVCDVAELLRRRPDLDWDYLWRQAERLRGARMVRLGLYLATEWLGAPLPTEARRRVRRDPAVPPLAATAIGAMEAADGPFRAAWKGAFHVRSRDGFADGLRYGWRRALDLNANDWTSVALPDRLHALYYPLRILRILRHHAAGVAGHPRGTARLRNPSSDRSASPRLPGE